MPKFISNKFTTDPMSLLTQASICITPNGYKEGKLYSVIPSDGSGDLSVTRATTATRVNSAGLVELVPYNLLQYSEQFDNGYWTNFQSSVTANSIVAPDGTTTADLITQTGAGSGSVYLSSITLGSGLYTASCYFHTGTTSIVTIDSNGSSGYWGASFNLDTEIITPFGTLVSSNIENLGNGWYRCSVTVNTSGSRYIAFGIVGTTGVNAYAWGAQLNEGTIKPYQKTETRLNIPRLDYSNGTCPSILVEPQRTNLVTYSSSFDSSDWSKSSGTITANSTTAPDGTATADTFTGNGALSNHDFFEGFTGGANTTASIYVKKNTAQFVYISLNYQSSGVNWATGVYDLDNLTTATFQSGGVTNQVATITDEGNGWRRITLSVATANTSLYCMFGLSDSMSPTLGSRGRVENSSSQSFYAWGSQVEDGSYATSYIPTTSASVTRNADLLTKTSATALIGQTEGTIFVDFYNDGGSIYNPFSISDGYYGEAVYFEQYLGEMYGVIWDGGSQQFYFNAGALSIGNHRMAIAYKANDIAFYIDGVLKATDTSATIPTCSRIDVGSLASATIYKNYVNAAALWKTRLTNTQLAELTSL